jgi:hypothetical protein
MATHRYTQPGFVLGLVRVPQSHLAWPDVTRFVVGDEGESDLDRSRSLSPTPQMQQSENRIAHQPDQLSDWLGYTYPLVCPTR